MFQYYLADHILEWAKNNDVHNAVSLIYNYTITSNATEMIQEMSPYYQNIGQNALTLFDIMVSIGFLGIGLLVTLRVITSRALKNRNDFTGFDKIKRNKTKPIPFHKRLMLKLGLAEVKDGER